MTTWTPDSKTDDCCSYGPEAWLTWNRLWERSIIAQEHAGIATSPLDRQTPEHWEGPKGTSLGSPPAAGDPHLSGRFMAPAILPGPGSDPLAEVGPVIERPLPRPLLLRRLCVARGVLSPALGQLPSASQQPHHYLPPAWLGAER